MLEQRRARRNPVERSTGFEFSRELDRELLFARRLYEHRPSKANRRRVLDLRLEFQRRRNRVLAMEPGTPVEVRFPTYAYFGTYQGTRVSPTGRLEARVRPEIGPEFQALEELEDVHPR